jgi:hypothetical protein
MCEDLVTTERVAVIVYALATDQRLTITDVAEKCGITYHGARLMMYKIARVLPLTEQDGDWFIIESCQRN